MRIATGSWRVALFLSCPNHRCCIWATVSKLATPARLYIGLQDTEGKDENTDLCAMSVVLSASGRQDLKAVLKNLENRKSAAKQLCRLTNCRHKWGWPCSGTISNLSPACTGHCTLPLEDRILPCQGPRHHHKWLCNHLSCGLEKTSVGQTSTYQARFCALYLSAMHVRCFSAVANARRHGQPV